MGAGNPRTLRAGQIGSSLRAQSPFEPAAKERGFFVIGGKGGNRRPKTTKNRKSKMHSKIKGVHEVTLRGIPVAILADTPELAAQIEKKLEEMAGARSHFRSPAGNRRLQAEAPPLPAEGKTTGSHTNP